MGFWGTLGKWALPIAGIAAAPFTGGASLLGTLGVGAKAASAIGAGAGIAGTLASGASAQRAQDRGAQAEYDLLRGQLENNRVTDANTQALQFANARRGAETDRLRQIGSTDMLLGSRPPTDPRTHLSGAGYMSPETLQMIRQRAQAALEQGSDVPALQQTTATPEMPQGGKMDSFLNALSLGGTALGALSEAGLFRPRFPPVNPDQNAANSDRVNDIYGKVRFF